VRNARDQSPYECINPTSAAVIESPTIRVTIGGRAEFVCRPYSAGKYLHLVMSRQLDVCTSILYCSFLIHFI